MSGKAQQQAFCRHLLIDQGLTCQIVPLIMKNDRSFEDQILERERLYTLKVWRSNWHGDCWSLNVLDAKVANKKDHLAANSKTSKFWLNYQHMVGISWSRVAADRMGCWELHLSSISACLPVFAAAGYSNYLKSSCLYLQKMLPLENDHHEIYQKFKPGFHVIWHGNQHRTGLVSDLMIEQTLMQSTMSSLHSLVMQELTANSYSTSDETQKNASI